MTTSHDLLKQALEALENACFTERQSNVRDAIRAHLAKPEPEPVAYMDSARCVWSVKAMVKDATPLYRKEDV